MKPLELQFEQVCTACGEPLKMQNLAFSEVDLLPYHRHMTDCNRKHPNSYEQHSLRKGKTVNMISQKEAQTEYRKRRVQTLDVDADAVLSLLNNPLAIRIDTVDNAAHIVRTAGKYNISKSEAFRRILTEHREASGEQVQDMEPGESTEQPEYEPDIPQYAGDDEDLNTF